MIKGTADFLKYTLRVFSCSFSHPINKVEFKQEISNINTETFWPTVIIAFFIGMMLSVQYGEKIAEYGVISSFGGQIAKYLIRNIGPSIMGMLLAARVGSSVTAKLAEMVDTEQVDVLEAFGENPIEYLVVPRFISCVLSMPILVCYMIVVGILGGGIVAVWNFNILSTEYFISVRETIGIGDIFYSLMKAMVFGILIGLASTYTGLSAKRGSQWVAQATQASVALSFSLIFLSDFIITATHFLL